MSFRARVLARGRAAAGIAALVAVAGPAAAQIKGPTSCFKCHKPLAKTAWETTAAFHKKSVDQLSAPKAAAFAAAAGLASATAMTGKKDDCVSCHATVVGGVPSVGVSCESCHGPAGGYFTPHQEPAFYQQPESQWLGLRGLYKKPQAIAAMCIECHVTVDPRLKKAGHPAGEAFDAGKGLQKMVHWDSGISETRRRDTYNAAFYAQASAESPKLVAKRLGGAPAVAAAAAPKAPAPAPAKPAAGPAAAGGPAGAPAPAPATAPAAAPPPPARPRRAAAPADPFDWDQPVAALPADYPSDAAAPPAAANPARAGAPGAPAEPAAPRPARAVRPTAPSTAPELPVTPVEPVVAPSRPVPPAPPTPRSAPGPAVAAATDTRPPAARIAELRGRSVALLAALLKAKGAGQLDIPPPAPPGEFQGPDGELLRLQDEILYLALDSLRRPQP